ncbi:DUF1579 domain-containing protein [Niveispirillum sp. KHB5.9]|uniref:DUF1579 domain-containing protein n=1 Tax=Niveispirillum sp. KHB5.9 TaxID=3400269 RepID=UPI003A88F9EF
MNATDILPATRRQLLIAAAGAVLLPGTGPATAAEPALPVTPTAARKHEFAFLNGKWRVQHRKLKARLAGSTEWHEFEGTCHAWELLDGMGNADDNIFHDPTGSYRGAAFRRVDPKTGLWNIWWFDERYAEVGVPMQGGFKDGVGTFLADEMFNGKPIKVRFIWSEITRTSARWEQAFSPDGGKSWETNWVMRFERTA